MHLPPSRARLDFFFSGYTERSPSSSSRHNYKSKSSTITSRHRGRWFIRQNKIVCTNTNSEPLKKKWIKTRTWEPSRRDFEQNYSFNVLPEWPGFQIKIIKCWTHTPRSFVIRSSRRWLVSGTYTWKNTCSSESNIQAKTPLTFVFKCSKYFYSLAAWGREGGVISRMAFNLW